MSVGDRLKQLINDKRVTPYEVAVRTGINHSTISRVLNNSTAKLSIKNADKIANYFDIDVDWLMTGSGNKEHTTLITPSDNYNQDFSAIIDSNRKIAAAVEKISQANLVLSQTNQDLTGIIKELSDKNAQTLEIMERILLKSSGQVQYPESTETTPQASDNKGKYKLK